MKNKLLKSDLSYSDSNTTLSKKSIGLSTVVSYASIYSKDYEGSKTFCSFVK